MKSKLLTRKNLTIAAALLIIALLPQFTESGYVVQTMILILLYAYWSSAWNIIGGFGGQLSLGHAAFVGVGAYVTMILYQYEGISPWIGILIAGFLAGCISLVIGFTCFRLKGSYYTLSTVALLHVMRIIMTTQNSIFGYETNAALGMKINWAGTNFWHMQFVSKEPYFYIILVLFILCVMLCKYISTSKTGFYLSAINTNQDAANSLGVNVMGYKLFALYISAFMTAIGGGFYAFMLSAVDPGSMFGYDLSVRIMLLAVIGGRATLWGPILGAFILTPINEVLRVQLGSRLAGLSLVVYGIIMMLIVIYMPGGLVSVIGKKDKNLKETINKEPNSQVKR